MDFKAQARALYSRRPANVKVSQGGLARYLALSGPVCSVEPPRTRGISRDALNNAQCGNLFRRLEISSRVGTPFTWVRL